MKRRFALSFPILLTLALIGCESIKGTESSEIRIVASEKVQPANFDEIAFRREEAPHYSYAVRKVSNHTDHETIWELFQLTRKRPLIDFAKNEVLFLTVEESGSCPFEINSKDVKLKEQQITVKLNGSAGPCTADATPRTFVIQIPKEESEEYTEVIVIESSTKTTIPFNEH